MLDRGKISVLQMCLSMYLMVGATAILIIPAITAKEAKQDMWISPFWGSLSGFLAVWLAWSLYRLTPGKSIIQTGEAVLGPRLGKAAALLYILFLVHGAGLIVREYGEFIVGTILLKTPIVIVMGSIVLTAAFAVRSGIEVLGRFSLLLGPLFGLFLIGIVLLLIPRYEPTHMLPVMENGLRPSLAGAVTPLTWFMEFLFISFLFPHLRAEETHKALRAGMWAVALMLVTMVIANLSALFLFGEITGRMFFPVFNASHYISMAEFLEHLDAMVMALWVMGGFFQISMWYYVTVISVAQCFHLSDYRPIVYSVGILIIVFSLWLAPGFADLIDLFTTSEPFYSATMQILLPALTLIIGLIKRRRRPLSAEAEKVVNRKGNG